MSYFERFQIEFADSMSVDAFGRARVSEPETLLDGTNLFDTASLIYSDEQTSGTGTTSTFNTNEASVTIAVGATTAGKRTRQTLRRAPYFPGKSQLVFMTFIMGSASTGIQKRTGYFSDRNGIFFTNDEGTLKVVRRTFVTGSAVDTEIAQTNWNLDKLDGTGPSGVTLDVTKAQIFVIDFEWLGTGRVRVGFNIDGVTHAVHQFENANNLTTVYMQSPHLPVRYEIENDGTGAADSMDCNCFSVQSEGGQNPSGRTFGVSNVAIRTGINGTGSSRYGLLGLRINASFEEIGSIQPIFVSILGSTTNDNFSWELVMDPTVAGTPTWSDVTTGVTQFSDGTSSNTVTSGTILLTGVARSQAVININPRDLRSPGHSATGTPQELWVVVRPYSNMSVATAINWREY